ncbi:hypothetical protein JW998_16400 [candidate division KSB1 bacterium]|nr:hypothetical protein [candidate division KSB1 bacterium]
MSIAKYLNSLTVLLFTFSIVPFTDSDAAATFSRYDDLIASCTAAARQHPELLKIESLGKTLEKRDLWLLTLGRAAAEKPAIVIVGGVEADDITSTELCWRFIDSSLQAYGAVDSVKTILDHSIFYILPCVNPDAAEQLSAAVAYDRLLNSRAVDLDVDGALNEDGFDDLNGDGYITLMRVADPAGEWLIDPLEPRLMRRAEPGQNERGAYRLLTEGIDDDKDGRWNEDPVGGVNFNCNFSYNYKPFAEGAGPHPISEPETRAVADFLFSRQNIAVVFSFSSNENLLHPWDVADADAQVEKPVTKVLPDDGKLYKSISEQFKRLTGFADPPAPERGCGAFSEWAYYHYGRWSFAAPAWYPPAATKVEDSTDMTISDDPIASERRLLAWTMKNRPQMFVEWSAIDHPDFPDQKVEIGGFAPGAKNPPADTLAPLADKFSAFFYQLANALPKPELQTKVEACGDKLYRLTATMVNSGYLPTCCDIGARLKWLRKVKAELILSDEQKIISGNRFYLVDKISAVAVEKSWLVMARRGSTVKIVVASPSVGLVEKAVKLY